MSEGRDTGVQAAAPRPAAFAPDAPPVPVAGTPPRILSARLIIGVYLVASIVWIALSDRLVASLFPSRDTADTVATVKGWFFVAFTAGLLAVLLRRYDAQRTRDAAELAASEQGFRFLAEHSADIIMRFRVVPTFALEYVSPSVLHVLGYPPEAFLADPGLMNRLGHPDDRGRINPRSPADDASNVVRLRHRDGRWVSLERRSTLIHDAAGQLVTIETTARDATERLAAEDTIRRSEERYRRITASTTDYDYTVRVLDGRAVSTDHGPGSTVVTGYAPDDFAADPLLWLRIVEAGDRDAVLDQARAALAGELPEPVEHRITRRDGTLRWVRASVVLEHDGDGRLIGYDGLISDITERRALQDELRQVQKMEAVGQLAGGIAHDFNNLLTAIRGYADLVRQAVATNDAARADIDEVISAADRAADLTAQLLAFSRRQMLQPQVLDPATATVRLSLMLARLLGEHIDVDVTGASSCGRIKVDPGQLEQVLVNLAVNAGHAMPSGGRLAIATSDVTVGADDRPDADLAPGSYVMLSVADTGAGMDPETRARAFEPFFTTKGQGKGTGMGLATVYGIVTQSLGQIHLESEPGRGTTFRIYFPRVDEPATTADDADDAAPGPTGSEKVLIVEDDGAVRAFARRSLTACGYSVLEAPDGAMAVDLAAGTDGPIELLLTDLVMPGINGRVLADELRATRPAMRVLYVSGFPENHLTDADLSRPGVGFLPKPYRAETLARAVRDVLDEPAPV